MLLVIQAIILCSFIHSVHAGTSAFLAKPQGFYSMHFLRPQDDFLKRCEQPQFFSATLAYHHSSNSSDIARALFGTQTLQFVGSSLPRIPGDILADNFGLAPNFRGSLSLAPQMQTTTLDLLYHLSLANVCEHLFLEFSAPLVFTRWDLHACEIITQRGSPLFPPCTMSSIPDATVATASTIMQAVSGNFLFGNMQEPWYNGRFVFKSQDITRLADFTIALGYNLYESEYFRLSASLLSIMPTGNHFKPTEIFYPVVGNASHWELGASFTANAHYSWDDLHCIDGYCIATFTHPFDNQQRRSFDFIGQGPLSRYTLLEKLKIVSIDGVSTLTYNNALINAINFTTRCVEVGCGIEGDLAAKLSYQRNHCLLEGGYVVYGRTREHIHIACTKTPDDISGEFYTMKATSLCNTPVSTPLLTVNDLDISSAEIPSSTVQTFFLQGGYQWDGHAGYYAMMVGASGSRGSYGCYHALNEWSIWTQFRLRF